MTTESSNQNRLKRLDKKLGMLWSRFWAIVIGLAGVGLLSWYFTAATDKSLGGTVFIVGIGAVLLFVARVLWRQKDGIVEILDDVDQPIRRENKPTE